MMYLSGSNLGTSVPIHPYDWTIASRPRQAAAKLIDAQRDDWSREHVPHVERVWIVMDGERVDLDASAVRSAAAEMLARDIET